MKQNKYDAIALERIYRLFELAEEEMDKKPERSKRYIELARFIEKRYPVRWPPELKTKFCKKCNAFLKKGKNAKIAKKSTLTIVKCLECGFERKTGTKK
ncbi:MAG: ribonuclease P [Candidatus Diapherotrites archaeon CG11_big_fil_rev_8_21_14_0_20_37_9]|nr:MAG: ribonuclease P [Candidatus Diapherotrites archaeon CG11_big_fil_rev_8_21_14_0_20_37_9]